ncbi:MAG: hypothetical protein FJ271_26650 [Planctomycetes bacterium]|nr:hypothetical protein [Planctomycetota bacterium]
MTRGRRPDGAKRADRLTGSTEAKSRLRWVLDWLTGRHVAAEACLALGIGERRFHGLVDRCLQAALHALEPRTAGRPASTRLNQRFTRLEYANRDLRIDLRAAQIREEIALTMPLLLQRSKKARARRPKSARPCADNSNACGGC